MKVKRYKKFSNGIVYAIELEDGVDIIFGSLINIEIVKIILNLNYMNIIL